MSSLGMEQAKSGAFGFLSRFLVLQGWQVGTQLLMDVAPPETTGIKCSIMPCDGSLQ